MIRPLVTLLRNPSNPSHITRAEFFWASQGHIAFCNEKSLKHMLIRSDSFIGYFAHSVNQSTNQHVVVKRDEASEQKEPKNPFSSSIFRSIQGSITNESRNSQIICLKIFMRANKLTGSSFMSHSEYVTIWFVTKAVSTTHSSRAYTSIVSQICETFQDNGNHPQPDFSSVDKINIYTSRQYRDSLSGFQRS